MSLLIVKAGLQTTLQGAPFCGHRHIGMPAAGAADSLSLALANALAGNNADAIAVEITLDAMQLIAQKPCVIAVSGASSFVNINGCQKKLYTPLTLKSGDKIYIAPAVSGCRTYLAINKLFVTERVLDNHSTYMPARLGGFHGRSLKNGDILEWDKEISQSGARAESLEKYSLFYSNNFILRITDGPEWDLLEKESIAAFTNRRFKVGRRANRMGLELTDNMTETSSLQQMLSAPVFPGTIQCPPGGEPFLLGPDAQTTGGYPRVAQVIRADRHLIGQLRPGSQVQFVRVSPEKAAQIYRAKLAMLKPILGYVRLW